jgi:hypothetical protein
MGPTFSGLYAAVVQQGGSVGIPADWATSTSYPTAGILVINRNNGNLYRVETAGTSNSTGTGPSGQGTAITDGTVVWSGQGTGSQAQEYIGGLLAAQSSYNAGGTGAAAIGHQWGGIISSQGIAGATFYSENVVLELDDNWASAVRKSTGLQIVRFAKAGIFTDIGLSLSAQTPAEPWRRTIELNSATDPAVGYVLLSRNQSASNNLQHFAGGFDLKLTVADGLGPFGGGFFYRWANGSIRADGSQHWRYGSVVPTSSGLTIDVPYQELTALSITGGGANWAVGEHWLGNDGSSGTVATLSGTAIATVTIVTPSQVLTPPGTVNISAIDPNSTIPNSTGDPTWPTAATATPTYAAPAAPAIDIGLASATNTIIAGASSKLAFYGATPIVKATPTGACAGNTGCQALRDALGNLGLINTGSITN